MEQSVRITAITIENFKGISKPVKVSLRPITLLFGKNSAGKSTILQALAYIHEVLAYQNLDARQTTLGGNEVELGGFAEFVHKKDKTLNTVFRLEFTGNTMLGTDLREDRYLSAFELSDFGDETIGNLDYFHGWNIAHMEGFYLEFEIAYSATLNRPCLIRYTVGDISEDRSIVTKIADIMYTPGNPDAQIYNINESYLFKMDIEGADGKSDQIDILQKLYEYCEKCGQSADGSLSSNVYDASLSFTTDINHGALPKLGEIFSFPALRSDSSSSDEFNRQQYNAAKAIETFFTEYMVKPAEYALEYLSNIRYIGPIRKIPSRSFAGNTDMRKSRWANGLAAWDVLYNAAPPEDARSDNLIVKINDYLRDVLALGYELQRKNVIEIDVNGSIMNTLRKAALQFEEIDEQKFRNAILNGLEKQSIKSRLSLHDLNNEVDVTPSDIGVGVSQVVPVVVGALAKTAENKFPSILSIEQPELHIHPAVQCALGDLFIREKSDSRIFLLETHSEHLILRFLRRISETTDNELKDPSLALRPDELGVIYVNTADNELTLTELPVDNDGEFTTRWPEGFFEERATELFGESDA
jgi:predicted ATPase